MATKNERIAQAVRDRAEAGAVVATGVLAKAETNAQIRAEVERLADRGQVEALSILKAAG